MGSGGGSRGRWDFLGLYKGQQRLERRVSAAPGVVPAGHTAAAGSGRPEKRCQAPGLCPRALQRLGAVCSRPAALIQVQAGRGVLSPCRAPIVGSRPAAAPSCRWRAVSECASRGWDAAEALGQAHEQLWEGSSIIQQAHKKHAPAPMHQNTARGSVGAWTGGPAGYRLERLARENGWHSCT